MANSKAENMLSVLLLYAILDIFFELPLTLPALNLGLDDRIILKIIGNKLKIKPIIMRY